MKVIFSIVLTWHQFSCISNEANKHFNHSFWTHCCLNAVVIKKIQNALLPGTKNEPSIKNIPGNVWSCQRQHFIPLNAKMLREHENVAKNWHRTENIFPARDSTVLQLNALHFLLLSFYRQVILQSILRTMYQWSETASVALLLNQNRWLLIPQEFFNESIPFRLPKCLCFSDLFFVEWTEVKRIGNQFFECSQVLFGGGDAEEGEVEVMGERECAPERRVVAERGSELKFIARADWAVQTWK